MLRKLLLILIVASLGMSSFVDCAVAEEKAGASQPLALEWKENKLTIHTPNLLSKTIPVLYMEAFCRPGSTNANWWEQTLIPHKTERLADSDDGKTINLISHLEDGVNVTHRLSSTTDEVRFHLEIENPTNVESQAHWGQSCIRVSPFAGRKDDDYISQCFVFIDNKLTRLPTQPWATEALLTPGQVYCPRNVPRTDVNPRPLSSLVPSNGLIGCYSGDNKWIVATAWQPYQELFQGVYGCIHSDLRIGGLKPKEKKEIHGKIYITDAGISKLLTRYEKDFPEHLKNRGLSEKDN